MSNEREDRAQFIAFHDSPAQKTRIDKMKQRIKTAGSLTLASLLLLSNLSITTQHCSSLYVVRLLRKRRNTLRKITFSENLICGIRYPVDILLFQFLAEVLRSVFTYLNKKTLYVIFRSDASYTHNSPAKNNINTLSLSYRGCHVLLCSKIVTSPLPSK